MLYDRWLSVVRERRDELAVRETATDRRWTFQQLAAEAEAGDSEAAGLACPQGGSVDFILGVLRAWRTGRVVCPLEPGQAPPDVSIPPAPCVHLKTTSATTGRPRLIALSAPQLAADAANIVATMGLRAGWPNLGVISLAHSYGFSSLVTPLLLHGIPLILCPSALPEAVRRAAIGEIALTLPAVPAMWRAWHDAEAIPASVCLAISAGAPLPANLERAVHAARGLKIHNFYGASECGGIAYDATPEPREETAFVGTALANVTLRIGESGRMEVRGPSVAGSYWPEPDEVLEAGCFRTGDLAELRAGRVFLSGRVSDLINVAGRKVAPETIEETLRQHPGVRDCLVFGVPDVSLKNESIMACVVTNGVSTTELRAFLAHRLPAWQVPRGWQALEALPTSARGKLSRAEWRERIASREQPARPAPGSADTPIR